MTSIWMGIAVSFDSRVRIVMTTSSPFDKHLLSRTRSYSIGVHVPHRERRQSMIGPREHSVRRKLIGAYLVDRSLNSSSRGKCGAGILQACFIFLYSYPTGILVTDIW